VFDHVFGVQETTAGTPATTLGDVHIIIELDDVRLDILKTAMGKPGLEFFKLRVPSEAATSISDPYLEPQKLEVLGDHTLKLIIRNVSGAALYGTAQAGFTFKALARYSKFV